MDDTPPGSPTATSPQHHGQFPPQPRSRVHSPTPSSRSPSSTRAFVHPGQGSSFEQQRGQDQYPTRTSSHQQRQPPTLAADTSSNSISSIHSYSSINSNSTRDNRDGATSIISNSILTSTVNQSISNGSSTGGGLNSNNSFFTSKQGNITRGISTMSGPSPSTSPSPQPDRVPSANSSPVSSTLISRPPMSTQRTHGSSSKSSQALPALGNTSFSSVGSIEGATVANGSSHLNGTQESQPVAHVEASSVTRAAQPASTSGSTAQAAPATQQHSRSTSSHGQNSQGHSHSHSHPQSASHPRKHRTKGDGGRDAPRPSATVSPAPTPAMHWTRAKVHGQIPPKDLRAQTVNLVGESVYVFGGCDTKTCYNTLYIFDADTMHWSQPKTFGSIPPPCRAHSSTLVDNKRLYVFGGGDGPQYFNELYMLDTDTLTWTNPQTTGDRPCRRRAHTTCVYNNCIYVFGGGDGVQALNDTYQLNLADMHWTELKTTGTIPISRGYHTSNLIKSQFIVYGGSDGHECFSDVHVLDLDTREWVKIDINRALPRLSHTATQVGSYLFVVGGHDGSRYSCDVVMLNLVTWSWETRKVYGLPPAGRGYHASLLYDSRLFMFGGYDGQTVFDDIYILDLSTCAYLPQITDFQILLRRDDLVEEDESRHDVDS